MQEADAHPVAKLLVCAFMRQRIDRAEMLKWADDLGLRREELNEAVYLEAGKFRSPLLPTPDGAARCVRCTQAAIAFAYAHGRIAFDELLEWAHQAGLDREQTDELIALSAYEAHGDGARGGCDCSR
jgi:hypothetical protein